MAASARNRGRHERCSRIPSEYAGRCSPASSSKSSFGPSGLSIDPNGTDYPSTTTNVDAFSHQPTPGTNHDQPARGQPEPYTTSFPSSKYIKLQTFQSESGRQCSCCHYLSTKISCRQRYKQFDIPSERISRKHFSGKSSLDCKTKSR